MMLLRVVDNDLDAVRTVAMLRDKFGAAILDHISSALARWMIIINAVMSTKGVLLLTNIIF